MQDLRFVWDERKNTLNKRKHGVSFEEGQTVFADDHGLLIHDPEHSNEEDRWLLLGMSSVARLLVVCHTYREPSDIVRIISVWPATRPETSQYVKGSRS